MKIVKFVIVSDDDEKVTIITIPVTEEGQGEEEVYNAVMNVEEFLAEHNIRHVFISYGEEILILHNSVLMIIMTKAVRSTQLQWT